MTPQAVVSKSNKSVGVNFVICCLQHLKPMNVSVTQRSILMIIQQHIVVDITKSMHACFDLGLVHRLLFLCLVQWLIGLVKAVVALGSFRYLDWMEKIPVGI